MDPSLTTTSIDPPQPLLPFLPPPIITTTAAAFTAAAATVIEPQNHTAHAANATPNLPPPLNNHHPPYAEMICAAITALKEKNGSSKRAIAKYIEREYSDLPPTHPALLTHNLKRLKNSGLLVMVKKSYKLPRSDIPNNNTHHAASSSPSGPKKGRGRPPKPKPDAEPMLVALGLVDDSDMAKRGPGRPRKIGPGGQGGPVLGAPTSVKKSPGRPKKPKSVGAVLGPNGLKRSRGRPPKTMIVPYATSMPNVPSARGRPKKVAAAVAAAAAGGGVALGKRRGRPPKIGGVSKPRKARGPKNPSARPVGRPKKSPTWAVAGGPGQQDEAYGDLKRKLEFFQSKVRQAVGVLKPQLTGESSITAVAAIHDLEGLAGMDISTPLKEDAQPPMA